MPEAGNRPAILVTGANGFIGQALCNHLHEKGYGVTGVVRGSGEVSRDYHVPAGAINHDSFWLAVTPRLANVDIVVHLASMLKPETGDRQGSEKMRLVNVEGTKRLLHESVKAGVKRFIYLSSISVNGIQTTNEPFNEESDTSPGSIYAVTKYEAEQLLKQASANNEIETVVIRPPMVLGKSMRSNLISILKRAIINHIPLPLGRINNKRAYISRDSMVDLLERCITRKEAANQLFVVADDNVSLREMTLALANGLNKKALLLPFPGVIIRLGAMMTGKKYWASTLLDDLVIDSSKAGSMLDWGPARTKQQTLEELTE